MPFHFLASRHQNKITSLCLGVLPLQTVLKMEKEQSKRKHFCYLLDFTPFCVLFTLHTSRRRIVKLTDLPADNTLYKYQSLLQLLLYFHFLHILRSFAQNNSPSKMANLEPAKSSHIHATTYIPGTNQSSGAHNFSTLTASIWHFSGKVRLKRLFK